MSRDLCVKLIQPRLFAPIAARGEVLTPDDLCRDRGIDTSRIGDGRIFVDDVLGFVVFDRPDQQRAESARSVRSVGDAAASFELALDTPAASAASSPDPFQFWFVNELPRWPQVATGKEQRIAVFDTGIAHGLGRLPRVPNDEDFCAISKPGASTQDIDTSSHGTCCAGVIAARAREDEKRRSIAPDSQVVAVQIVRPNAGNVTTLVDLLLMLSWAIHRWNVRIVSMSFADIGQRADSRILEVIAARLRQTNRALIFSAAACQNDDLSYPARVENIVAVGEYVTTSLASEIENGTIRIAAANLCSARPWLRKRDLLFAPASRLTTLLRNGADFDDFGGASGACAFAAGLAAVYMETYPSKTVDEILEAMKSDARPIADVDGLGKEWPAVNIPSGKPPGTAGRFFARVASKLRTAVKRLERRFHRESSP